MSGETDFDALSRRASESNGAMGDLDALYGAVFALERWHFVARGQFPDVHPYVASNAGQANGKPMIRAFTDADRVLRFAKENDLTDEDGGAPDLNVPTEGIVDYLEKFRAEDVWGIWVQLRRAERRLFSASRPASSGSGAPGESKARESGSVRDVARARRDAGYDPEPRSAGEISFDAALPPLYQAIAPLLEEYRGVGEYTDLLQLDASARESLVESVASSAHGACLRVRRFLYRSGAAGVGFDTLDSRELRHARTGTTMLVNFALCKNLDDPAAKLYFRFEGPRSEVLNLLARIAPLLEKAGFRGN